MVDVAEHVYDDDPGQGHADVRTRLAGVNYYLLGNGLIQAAVQHASRGEGTPLALLGDGPDLLRKKRDALTMHPRFGLEPSAVHLVTATNDLSPLLNALTVSWQSDAAVPTVVAAWGARGFTVQERFYCPSASRARLAREVTITLNRSTDPQVGWVRTSVPGSTVMPRFSVKPGARTRVWLIYDLDPAAGALRVTAAATDPSEAGAGCPGRLYRHHVRRAGPRPPLPCQPGAVARRGVRQRPHGRQHLAIQPRVGPGSGLHRHGPGHVRSARRGPDDAGPAPLRFRQRGGRDVGFEPLPPLGGKRSRPERRSPLRPRILRPLDRGHGPRP